MTIIVNSGTTLTINNATGLTLTANGTVAAGGLLDGAGTIAGSGFTLLNQGTISADSLAATLAIATGTLTNQGTISASTGTLSVQSQVAVTNLVGTTLTGGFWAVSGNAELDFLGGQIFTDNATIILNGTAAVFAGFDAGAGTLQPIENSLTTVGTAGRLDLLGGRSFTASTSLVVNGTITLAGGSLSAINADTIGATGRVVGFGTLDPNIPLIANGLVEAQGGTLTLPAPGIMSGAGTIQVDAGAVISVSAQGAAYAQTIVNNGIIAVSNPGIPGKLAISGIYSGTGSFLIQGGFDATDLTTLELPAGLSVNVGFDQNAGVLLLDAPATFSGTVAGFGNTDTIILSGLANARHIALSGNTLNLTNNSNVVVQTLKLDTTSLNYQAAAFTVTENAGNNLATVKVSGATAACYAAGTSIATRDGETAVENLAAGDIVRAHFAGEAAVVWIGHRRVDCRRHKQPWKVWPVRVEAHAFGPRQPMRDLYLSPDHAVFVDGLLIPIRNLINGTTITQTKMDTVNYYHVELVEHDVIFADGLPAESYLENGDRAAFDNGGLPVMLHPEFAARRWEALGCAPFANAGPGLARVKARIDRRASDFRSTGRKPSRVA